MPTDFKVHASKSTFKYFKKTKLLETLYMFFKNIYNCIFMFFFVGSRSPDNLV